MVDFRGEKRTNATHESSTDPEAKLMRKGNGQPARLGFGAHAMMENRNGLLVDLAITDATLAEPKAAYPMLDRRRLGRRGLCTLGADKGYHSKAFVSLLRKRAIAPHIARIEGRNTPGLDTRTTRHDSSLVSQHKRRRVEEIFGWMKAIGGFRKTRFVGSAKTQLAGFLVGAVATTCCAWRGSPRARRRRAQERAKQAHSGTRHSQRGDMKITPMPIHQTPIPKDLVNRHSSTAC